MAKYCTQCGALLNGNKFCIYCGAKAASNTENNVDQPGDTASQDTAPQAQVVLPQEQQASSSRKSFLTFNSTTYALLAACALGICIGVAMISLHPWSPDQNTDNNEMGSSAGIEASAVSSISKDAAIASSSETAQNEAGESSQNDMASSVKQEASSSVPVIDYYEDLNGYYGRAAGYDGRISDVANVFNNTYLSKSFSERTTNAGIAKDLMREISTDFDSLNRLGVAQDSPYYANYCDMKTLYNDLLKRSSVICSAWDISTRYNDPSSHKDEILAPLVVDNDASGKNIYKKEFEELYPRSAPQKL